MWILLSNIDLRCFVARQFLSQIYALLSVKFSGLKMCECKKNDKYEVWVMMWQLKKKITKHIDSIDVTRCWLILIDEYWCWLLLIDADAE